MKKCRANQTVDHKNSDHCVVTEFPILDKDINFATSKITARYPDYGFACNKICKEIVYIQEGSGKIVVDGKEYGLNTGDTILISAGEKFFWDGNMTLHIACTPAFTPDQHIYISE